MRIIERYICRQTLVAFCAALAALTGVIWITQSLRQVDLLTTKGQTLLIFLALTGLTIPSLVVGIAPIALFIGAVHTLNKLDGDSELVVLNAAGVSPARMIRPFCAVAGAATLACAALSLWAAPASTSEISDLITKVRADFLTRVIQQGTFVNLDDGFVFEYRERGADGSLRGVFMQDRRDPQHVSTYAAQSGETVLSDNHNFLVLNHGMIQRQAKASPDPATVTFDRYAIDLSQFGPAADGAPRKPRERSTLDLLRISPSDPEYKKNPGAFRAELNDRFSEPLWNLTLGLIGFAALFRARTSRSSRGATIAAATIVALLLRGAGFWATALTQRHAWAVWLVYALPALGFAGALFDVFGPPWRGLAERCLATLRLRERVGAA